MAYPVPTVRALRPVAVLPSILIVGINWQEWQGSNLRPPVLETGALPIELHSYGPCVAARIRAAFKHRGRLDCKGEPRRLRLFVQRLLGHSPFPTIKSNRECP